MGAKDLYRSCPAVSHISNCLELELNSLMVKAQFSRMRVTHLSNMIDSWMCIEWWKMAFIAAPEIRNDVP